MSAMRERQWDKMMWLRERHENSCMYILCIIYYLHEMLIRGVWIFEQDRT